MTQWHLKQTHYLWVSLVVLFSDQLTKMWAQQSLILYEPRPVSTFLNFTLARNTGAAFSFLDSASGWQSLFFVCLNILISLGILVWLLQLKSEQIASVRLKSWGLSLILGGAIGNIIDRIQLGYVVDFLDLYHGMHHWPIFNVADSAVCVGVSLLMLGIYKEEKVK
jgi:signal peptidase II